MHFYRLMISFGLLIATVNPSYAQTIAETFNSLMEQTKKGISGYEGIIKPIKGEISLKYGAADTGQKTVRHIINFPPDNFSKFNSYNDFLYEYTYNELVESNQMLKIRLDNLKISINSQSEFNDGSSPETYILNEAKISASTDRSGNLIKKEILLPPKIQQKKIFEHGGPEILSLLTKRVLDKPTARQDDVIFLPFFEVNEHMINFKNFGRGSALRGTTECGSNKCFMIEVDEKVATEIPSLWQDAYLTGYLLLNSQSLNLIESILKLRVKVYSKDKTILDGDTIIHIQSQ